jgi:hypothetical protein
MISMAEVIQIIAPDCGAICPKNVDVFGTNQIPYGQNIHAARL